MSKLVLVRHGDYGSDGELTDRGRSILRKASKLLSQNVDPPVRIGSSVLARARHSTSIIAEQLTAASIEYFEELATGKDAPNTKYARGDLSAAHRIVERLFVDARTVVLVTHYEICDYYPDFFLEARFGPSIGSRPMRRGEILVIDCETGECRLLERDSFVASWNGITGQGFARCRHCGAGTRL